MREEKIDSGEGEGWPRGGEREQLVVNETLQLLG